MDIVIFRHTYRDNAGCLESALNALGERCNYIDTFMEDFDDFDALSPDLLIVLGGAPGVYQADSYKFIRQEISILEKRLAADKPTIGICLGAQMMAKALGADVYKGKQGSELGWHPLHVNEAGMNTPVRHLDKAQTMMMQWHGDTFDMPRDATLLASSDKYDHQVFSWGDNAIALQCHAEVTPLIMKSWLVGSAAEALEGAFDLEKMRNENDQWLPKLETQSARFMKDFIAKIKKERAVA